MDFNPIFLNFSGDPNIWSDLFGFVFGVIFYSLYLWDFSVSRHNVGEYFWTFLQASNKENLRTSSFWSNYSDLSRGHLRWWFCRESIPKMAEKIRLMIYIRLPRSLNNTPKCLRLAKPRASSRRPLMALMAADGDGCADG